MSSLRHKQKTQRENTRKRQRRNRERKHRTKPFRVLRSANTGCRPRQSWFHSLFFLERCALSVNEFLLAHFDQKTAKTPCFCLVWSKPNQKLQKTSCFSAFLNNCCSKIAKRNHVFFLFSKKQTSQKVQNYDFFSTSFGIASNPEPLKTRCFVQLLAWASGKKVDNARK